MPIDEDVEGAQAIRVSNKPDGYLGQPFEFESEFYFIKFFICLHCKQINFYKLYKLLNQKLTVKI
jgi:hypothetical protein